MNKARGRIEVVSSLHKLVVKKGWGSAGLTVLAKVGGRHSKAMVPLRKKDK